VLPLDWFYMALVVFSCALLLYLELRVRAKRHVKGCKRPKFPSSAGLYLGLSLLSWTKQMELHIVVLVRGVRLQRSAAL
jgi:hypothetical protein